MEQKKLQPDMLDFLPQPAFYAQNGSITRVNQAAASKSLEPGTEVSALLKTGAEEYALFQGGELYLSLTVENAPIGASVTRLGDKDVFILEQSCEQEEFHALALAAQELRDPLATIITVSDRLLSNLKDSDSSAAQLSRFNQGIYKLHRLIGNMSYAEKCNRKAPVYTETCNLRSFFEELSAAADGLVSMSNRTLVYSGLEKDAFCLVNKELLERAFYNLLSNAIKFSPEESVIRITQKRNRNRLYLTVENQKDNFDGKDFFTGFHRDPGICDGRCGIGLGMVLVRSAASSHNGTVLVEQTETHTRITMSLLITQSSETAVRSPVLFVDYAGDRDHKLIELSDALPAEAYKNI